MDPATRAAANAGARGVVAGEARDQHACRAPADQHGDGRRRLAGSVGADGHRAVVDRAPQVRVLIQRPAHACRDGRSVVHAAVGDQVRGVRIAQQREQADRVGAQSARDVLDRGVKLAFARADGQHLRGLRQAVERIGLERAVHVRRLRAGRGNSWRAAAAAALSTSRAGTPAAGGQAAAIFELGLGAQHLSVQRRDLDPHRRRTASRPSRTSAPARPDPAPGAAIPASSTPRRTRARPPRAVGGRRQRGDLHGRDAPSSS